jgi:hypothetical protein
MILSVVLSHDVVVPVAGCHVEFVVERLSRLCATGAANADANSEPKIKKLCIVLAVYSTVLITLGRRVGIYEQSVQRVRCYRIAVVEPWGMLVLEVRRSVRDQSGLQHI